MYRCDYHPSKLASLAQSSKTSHEVRVLETIESRVRISARLHVTPASSKRHCGSSGVKVHPGCCLCLFGRWVSHCDIHLALTPRPLDVVIAFQHADCKQPAGPFKIELIFGELIAHQRPW